MAKRKSRPKAVVLLSAGLDSSFNLLKASQELDVVLALTFDYGQRAAPRETRQARALAKQYGVAHKVVRLPWFKEFTRTSLVSKAKVPTGRQVRIDSRAQSLRTAKSVWVPNRNGILLSIAAGFAEGLGANLVIPGFNLEEAQTFPDNSLAYLKTLDQTWAFSTASHVRTKCYSIKQNKTQIVAEGKRLGLPFAKLWPCYFAGRRWCGVCESCQRYSRALAANGLDFSELSS